MRHLYATIFLLFTMLSSCTLAHAYTTDDAIKSIIGEAENQGYKGMLAVACAIRNRGSLKGVYGLKNPRVKKALYSRTVYLQACNAWTDSLLIDITKGANSWENVTAFGKPYWASSCIETVKIKDHQFYRCSI